MEQLNSNGGLLLQDNALHHAAICPVSQSFQEEVHFANPVGNILA